MRIVKQYDGYLLADTEKGTSMIVAEEDARKIAVLVFPGLREFLNDGEDLSRLQG